MGFINADRRQIDLIGYSVDEFVEKGSLVRVITDIVERLDLSRLYCAYSGQGGDAFDPSTMLSIWLFAYAEGQNSTRRVEELCRRDLHYIYVSANLKPDHCSLSRFRQRHAEVLPELFVQVVRLAHEEGLASFRRLSVDGSKIEASASSKANRNKDSLEKELSRLREEARNYLERCACEEGPSTQPDLERRQKELEQAQATLEVSSADLSPANKKKHLVNLTDPQARSMAEVNGSRSKNAYNSQIAVDEDSGMIAHCSVVDDPNDRKQLCEVHRNCEENLGKDPSRQYTADSGYHSFSQLEYIHEQGIDAVVAEPRVRSREASDDGDYLHRGAFRYEKDKDCYTCPAGQTLSMTSREYKRGRLQFVYQCRACPTCSLRTRCLKNPSNPQSLRKINRDSQEHLAEAMLAKSRSEQGRARMKRRACSVEPVFGNLKYNMGLRRFSLRGMKKVQGEFALMCIAHDLRKWARIGQLKPLKGLIFFSKAFVSRLLIQIWASIGPNRIISDNFALLPRASF